MPSSTIRTALDETSSKGAFVRTESSWRNWIDPNGQFPPEANRYHLYVAYACPWAHRTLIVRALKGLEHVISVTIVHPTWQRTRPDDPNDVHAGWVFGNPHSTTTLTNADGNGGPFPPAYPNNEPDGLLGAMSIRDVYEKAGDENGKYSVPVLWDTKLNTIVSNESSEIIQMFNSQFNEFAKNPALNLSPDSLLDAIEAANEWIYPTINNGVYKCGFAKSQQAYDEAIESLTNALDKVESILSTQRYLTGSQLTLADIRLFVTLIRFDPVYVVYFKTNTRSILACPNMLRFCRDIYQLEGVAETVSLEQIKVHYFTSHPQLNYWSIVPRGIDYDEVYRGPVGPIPS